jgi:hypothetical protein
MGLVSLVPSESEKGTSSTNLGKSPHAFSKCGAGVNSERGVLYRERIACTKDVGLYPEPRMAGDSLVVAHRDYALSVCLGPPCKVINR